MNATLWGGRTVRGRALALQALLAAASALTGCDSLLELDNPGQVGTEVLDTPVNTQLAVVSAITDFECAFANYDLAQALSGDEMTWGDLNTYEWDLHNWIPDGTPGYAFNPCASTVVNNLGVYKSLSTAQWTSARTHQLLEVRSDAEVPQRQAFRALMSAYNGYSVLLIGEAMCSGVVDDSPELSRVQLWQRAEDVLTRAIAEAQAAGADSTRFMALVGRARARINQGNKTGAADDARLVPAGFVKLAKYTETPYRASNLIYSHSRQEVRSAIEDDYFDLAWDGVPDPRVALTHFGKLVGGVRDGGARGTGGYPAAVITGQSTQDPATPRVVADKYPTASSPIPIARWAEAQLIIAETILGAEAVRIINDLHSRAGIPATFASSDNVQILGQVIEERRRELFLESQQLNDKIRFAAIAQSMGIAPGNLNRNLQFTPAGGQRYKNTQLTYGTNTCFPFPSLDR